MAVEVWLAVGSCKEKLASDDVRQVTGDHQLNYMGTGGESEQVGLKVRFVITLDLTWKDRGNKERERERERERENES